MGRLVYLAVWPLVVHLTWALLFDLDSTATQTAVISGVLVILAELLTLTVFRSWEEWINVILAAWLIVCPWIVGISSSTAKTNFVVIGALIGVLGLLAVRADDDAPP